MTTPQCPQGPRKSRKSRPEDLPPCVGRSLARALSYGDARAVAANFGCSEGHLSRLKNAERRMMADELPALVEAMAPAAQQVFLDTLLEAVGFRAVPLNSEAGDASLLRLRMAVGAALGQLDGAIDDASDDRFIDRVEAGGLIDELDEVQRRCDRLRAVFVEVRDEDRSALEVA